MKKGVFGVNGFFLFFCGLCMGVCDLVPGISGGTMALILGIYPKLIESLHFFSGPFYQSLKSKDKRATAFFQNQIGFLAILLSGVLVAIVGMSEFIQKLLNHETYRVYLYSTFFGLVLASFYFCITQVKYWSKACQFSLLLGICLGALLTIFPVKELKLEESYAVFLELPSSTLQLLKINNYDFEKKKLSYLSPKTIEQLVRKNTLMPTADVYDYKGKTVGKAFDFYSDLSSPFFFLDSWLVFCGAVAVCALLLPGISGSYLLTILGVYPSIIGAIANFFSSLRLGLFDESAFFILANLGMGILLGGISFSRFLAYLMKTCPNWALSCLSGVMLGSLHTLWPFSSYEYILLPLNLDKGPQLVSSHFNLPMLIAEETLLAICCSLLGFFIIFYLNRLAIK